ncbi:MAG: hypothetical protein Q4B95_09645 [Lonepinella koalarum]|nr:hypothetical protein [Lonepinella koalarum]
MNKPTYEGLLNDYPDMSLYSLNTRLEANSSEVYQNRAKLKAKILLKFLLDNHLLRNPQNFDFDDKIIDDLEITIQDVTADGFELFRDYVNNWYKAHDRGTPIEKITILEKGLAKIREEK